MRLFFILLTFLFSIGSSFCQQPFILALEQPELDFISDVVQISDRFYFIQNRLINVEPNYKNDSYSDLIITSANGSILEQYNLNGYRTKYQRILKVDKDEIYLIGSLKSDSCQSKLVISKFNIFSHTLNHISSYDFCESIMLKIKIINGLSPKTFIEEYHAFGPNSSIRKSIIEIDSFYTLTPVFDDLSWVETLSVDFSRTGYLIAGSRIYNFYDADFNYRKQVLFDEVISYPNETHIPFGQHLLLIQTVQKESDLPDEGIQIMLVDSSLKVKKKAVMFPMHSYYGFIDLPYFGGLDLKNENEIWASGYFGSPPDYDTSFYFISKLDSNLNILCQHFLGYDSKYRIFGLKSFDNGGAIVFGNRVREGHDFNEGEDIFAIRVGENCELPSTVSTNGPKEPLLSISVYPNPGINDLTFNVNGFDPATLRVEMIDELGQVLFTVKDLTNSIHVPELPAGHYFYRILQKDRLLGIGAWVKQ